MGFFDSIGSFFKGAANKVNSAILKPIGNFITHTVPDTAGKILGGIKDVAKTAIDKVPDIIDSGGKAIGSIIDKGSSLVTGVVDNTATKAPMPNIIRKFKLFKGLTLVLEKSSQFSLSSTSSFGSSLVTPNKIYPEV
jgi:phage-related protein